MLILFQILFPYRLLQNTEYSSLYYTVGPCRLSILYIKFTFLKKFYLFIYSFLAALGLCCCAWAFSSCSEWGLLFVAVHGL